MTRCISVSINSCNTVLESCHHRIYTRAYLDEVDFCEAFVVAGFLYVEDRNDVLMVEVPQEFHFSQCTQAEHGVIEWGDLLDSHFLARRFVQSRAATVSERAILEFRYTHQTTP